MQELLNRIPLVGILVLIVVIIARAYIRRLEKDRHEQRKLYDAILRINKSCERIGDILASTDFLVTVEESEERVIPYD